MSYPTYSDLELEIQNLEEENKKLKEERDFFKEQAILWRKYYKNEYEKNRKLESDLGTVIDERDNAFKKIEQLKEDLAYERTMLDNVKAEYENLQEINEKLREKTEKLEKELSAVYKAYHTALGVDYNNEEDLYTIEDIEGHNAE